MVFWPVDSGKDAIGYCPNIVHHCIVHCSGKRALSLQHDIGFSGEWFSLARLSEYVVNSVDEFVAFEWAVDYYFSVWPIGKSSADNNLVIRQFYANDLY